MRQVHQYSVLLFVIGLSVVQVKQPDNNGTETMVEGTIPPSVNVSSTDRFLKNHTTTESNPPTSNSKDAFSVVVLIGESNVLTVANVSDVKKRRYSPFLSQTEINIYSIDFHWTKGLIFYTAGDKTYRARFVMENHSLSDIRVIVNDTERARLAVDWVNDRLFWMSDKYQTVEVVDLDGENRKLLIDTIKPFRFPNNIVVDPYENAFFFVSNYSIFKSSLNGSHVERVSLDHNHPGQAGRGIRCISMDIHHHKLYLTGEKLPEPGVNVTTAYIARANYDGSELEGMKGVEKARKLSNIFGIDFFRNTLFFANFDRNSASPQDSLWTVDLTTNQTEKQYVPKTFKSVLWSIRVFHPQVQIKQQFPQDTA